MKRPFQVERWMVKQKVRWRIVRIIWWSRRWARDNTGAWMVEALFGQLGAAGMCLRLVFLAGKPQGGSRLEDELSYIPPSFPRKT